MRPTPGQPILKLSIFKTLAYAGIFEFPLTAAEVQRYLVGESTHIEDVLAALREEVAVGNLVEKEGFFVLPDRMDMIETRKQRSGRAIALWPQAIRYGGWLARLPFVRMVAVTGSLAVDNEPGSDIDYLIVTKSRRLWLCRGLAILVVYLARRSGVEVCPNYLISENALAIKQRDLYVAHEITQMVPIFGLQVYRRMREINSWTAELLPNATGRPRADISPLDIQPRYFPTRIAELVLNTRPAGWLEKWEMKRKIRKFQRLMSPSEEIEFSEDLCKGHFGEYGKHTMAVYRERTGEA